MTRLPPVDTAALYANGAHYDAHHREYLDDLPFWIGLAREHDDPILELACGTGRITLPLAEKGHRVVGLDVSRPMLDRARSKAPAGADVEFVEADCRRFDLDERFGLVFFPFNSIAHLHDRASLAACLACVRAHLAPGGRFLVDIFAPSMEYFRRDPERRYPVAEYPDPDGGGTVVVTESNVFDPSTQVNRIRWHYHLGESLWVVENNMRIFFPEELLILLEGAGLRTVERWGDYDRSPFTAESPKQLVLVEAADGR